MSVRQASGRKGSWSGLLDGGEAVRRKIFESSNQLRGDLDRLKQSAFKNTDRSNHILTTVVKDVKSKKLNLDEYFGKYKILLAPHFAREFRSSSGMRPQTQFSTPKFHRSAFEGGSPTLSKSLLQKSPSGLIKTRHRTFGAIDIQKGIFKLQNLNFASSKNPCVFKIDDLRVKLDGRAPHLRSMKSIDEAIYSKFSFLSREIDHSLKQKNYFRKR